MHFIICKGEKRQLWDDFTNAVVLARGFKSKTAARDRLSELAQQHPTVKSFSVVQIFNGGCALVSGPTKREWIEVAS